MNLFFPPFPRINRTLRIVIMVCLVTTFAGLIFVAARNEEGELSANSQTSAGESVKSKIAQRFGKLPLSFEVNQGQTDPAVKFLSNGAGYNLFLTANEAVLTLQKPHTHSIEKFKKPAAKNEAPETTTREGSVLRLKMIGANASPQVEGQDELPGKVNYFNGDDPAKWRRNVPTYRTVHYKDLYPGIDVVYYGNQRQLEYDFVVAPGADPKVIRFSVAGADRLRLDQAGNLLLTLAHGEVQLNKPFIYQLTKEGNRREVKGSYAIQGNEIRFNVRGFDSNKPLVIDPVLSYSTFLGGSGNDQAFDIAVDSQGSAYIAGITDGRSFPTTAGAFQTTPDFGSTAFVAKLNPAGSSLVYSTYVTGAGGSRATSIAVDSSGNAHITGSTSAVDFPIVNGLKTNGRFFKTTDAAANWNNNNTGLPGDVNTLAVAPNSPNIIYAFGTNGLHRSTDGGGTWIKLQAAGLSSFPFSTALAVHPTNSSTVYTGLINGGLFKSTDAGANWSLVPLPQSNSFVAFSIVFDPVTPSTMYVGTGNGAFKSTDSGSTWTAINNFGLPGVPNVRAIAIDPTTPATLYAGTFGSGFFKSTNGGSNWTAMNTGMGGNQPTFVNAIVIDPSNPATIYTGHGSGGGGGINKSTNGATSWAPVNNGVPSSQITAMVATASTVYAATGGSGIIKTTNGGTSWTPVNTGLWNSNVRAMVRHASDANTLFAGTSGTNLEDAFVTKLNASGSGLLFSTYLGGSSNEIGNDIAVDGSGNIYVTGNTTSNNFPAVNAVQSGPTATDTCSNGFVTRLNPAAPSYVFSTYLGGSACDLSNGIALDSSGNVYVTGHTRSSDFPTASPFQANIADQFSGDAFVSKFTGAGSFIYSTYLGGNNSDTGFGIAADASGNAFVTGTTISSNFPTANPIQPNNKGFLGNVFITKLNPQGSALVYSTYLGGSGTDVGRSIAIDASGNAYVAGVTNSPEFPILAGSLRTKSAVFKSVDGAASWSNDNYGLTTPFISEIAVDPTLPSTVYAGTGAGVFKSTNGGRTWTAINNGLLSQRVIALLIDPSTPSTLYVAANDSGGASNNGVYKSIDGGNSWNLKKTGMTNSQVISLAIDPVTPATLYAGALGNFYKTTNGADNWAPSGSAPPSFAVSIAVDPHTPTRIFAAESSSGTGVLRSLDSGATWNEVGQGQLGSSGVFVGVSPLTPGLMYARTLSGGLFKSINGGDNWTPVMTASGKLVFDPVSASTVYFLSSEQGLLRSTNNGQTFTPMNKGLPRPSASALAVNPLQPSVMHLGVPTSNDDDAFVTKINSSGNALIYSTLIGGLPPPGDSFNISDQAFGIALDSTGNAYVSGVARTATFPTTPNSVQPFNRGVGDAFISKLTMSHIISGKVMDGMGAAVSGAAVVLNNGSSIEQVITESDGTYEFSHLREGGSFTVTATKPHFTMAPPSQTFNNLNSNQVLNFTATATNAPFFTISGKVTDNGAGLSGVVVNLGGSQLGTTTTDSNGNFSFELAGGGSYTLTPSILGFTFGPAAQTFNNLSANQTANFPATRQNFVVTNVNSHGPGSLRDAITNANATVGLDKIVFNIPGAGVKVISVLIPLPEITDTVMIDGTTQPGYAGKPLVELDGAGTGDGNGLVIRAGGTTVKGLAIGRFPSFGIWIRDCDNNVIQGNHLGVDATGTVARGNNRGILLGNSSNNLIGGTTPAARNVISGNSFEGIEIGGSGNVVQGNFIGTNAAGTSDIRNGLSGVAISSSPFVNNVIGGTAPGAGNLISGNHRGISSNGPGTIIQGNLIGTDVTGTQKIPNGNGIEAGGTNILIGGLSPAARNIISGNDGFGVLFGGEGSKLQGNYIGTDITGTLPLGNSTGGAGGGTNALIGGTVPEARNVISANTFTNVSLEFNSNGPGALIQGNYIGTDVTGTRVLGNTQVGITISGDNNTIGGVVPGAQNVISGHLIGIQVGALISSAPHGNTIQGNLIGLNAQGTGPLPNTIRGVDLANATNTILGGTQSGAANKIAFNGGSGVSVVEGTGNAIRGNAIFSNAGLGIDLGPTGLTANDATDSDTGPNNLQNFPVLTSVISLGNSTTIQGSLKSTPNTTFQIDFYSNAALDASGHGEGALFFNTTSVNTDGNGNATINATFPAALGAGRIVTATATDANGNTSEFSAADATGATGNVQFSVSTFAVLEDVGLATITVLRKGGTTGSLTVDYATANGTATAGQDYTATSGTLSFSGGETSKTFQIPIAEDASTEPGETFTVALRNTSSLDLLGVPSLLEVTIHDSNTQQFVTAANAFVVEGNAGTTTELVFTINLTAATGKTVSVDYSTSNFSAFGGASCNTSGVDYESKSGKATFQPGTSAFNVPIRICGDTSAEANETFRLNLSNAVNATLPANLVIGTINNDDVLELITEESGPTVGQAAALDAVLLVRDPFRVLSIPEWFPTTPDKNTRVVLFVRNLQLNPGEPASAVFVRLIANGNQFFGDIAAEDVRPVANTDFAQVVFRLPNDLPAGTVTVSVRAHGRTSNTGSIRIVQ